MRICQTMNWIKDIGKYLKPNNRKSRGFPTAFPEKCYSYIVTMTLYVSGRNAALIASTN
jgi:hypothetical protein